ncbi:tetratricopeptide repeat protein [candidate division NPL-UPA2 bacterium]|nr:tetratricopeptide repeat protein [candidate division NPL-UPA2 bacterium]
MKESFGCKDCRKLLPDYLTRRLGVGERATVEEHLSHCEGCFNGYFSLIEKKVEEENLPPYMGGRPAWGPLVWSLDRERDLGEEIFNQAIKAQEGEEFTPILIKGDESQRTSVLFLELCLGARLKEKNKKVILYTPTIRDSLPREESEPGEEVRYLIVDNLTRFPDLDDFLLKLKKRRIVLIASLDCKEETFKKVCSLNPKIFSLKGEGSEKMRFSRWRVEGLKEEKEKFLEARDEVKNAYLSVCLLDRVGVPVPISLLKRLTHEDEAGITSLIKGAKGLVFEVEASYPVSSLCTRAPELAEGMLEYKFPENSLLSQYKQIIEAVDPKEREERITIIKLLHSLIYYHKGYLARELIKIMENSRKGEALRGAHTHPSELLGWARVCHQLRMYEKAEELFEEARRFYPENVYILHAYAKMMADGRKYKEAEGLFQKAFSLEPDNIYILQAWADMEAKRTWRHWPQARALWKRALEIDRQNVYVLVSYGNLELRAYRYQEAGEFFQQSQEIDKENLYALCSRGVMEKERLNYPEAERYWERVLELDERNIPTLHARGVMKKDRGHLKEAEEIFPAILEIDRENLYSLHSLAEVKIEKQEYEEAEKLFKKVLEIDPYSLPTYISWGVMEAKRGRFMQAGDFFKKAREVDDRSPYLYTAWADMLSRGGEYERAEVYFEKALGISGEEEIESVPIYNSLARMWQRRKDGDKARKYLEKARSLLGNLKGLVSIITLNTGADIETACSHYKEAEELYRKSLSLDEGNAYTHFSYAKMLRVEGKRKEEAKEHLKKSQELGLTIPEVVKLMKE